MSKVKYVIEMPELIHDMVEEKGTDGLIAFRTQIAGIIANATPLTECDDAVSRQVVIDAIEKEEYKWDALDAMKALPPVTPKHEQGEWIIKKDCEGKTRTCICPKCGEETGKYTWKNPNYCPNCGAEMR